MTDNPRPESRVQRLIRRLRSPDFVVRLHAGTVLGGMGPEAYPFEGGCHGLYLIGMMYLYTADQEARHAPRKSL